MMLPNQAEEIPTQAQVDRQLRSQLPVIVNESAVIILTVIGKGDVGDEHLVGASNEVNATGYGRGGRCEEEVCAARVTATHVWYVRVVTVIVEFPTGPRWLQRRECYVLPLETHLEGMLPVNLRDRVGDLESGGDLIRRQESVPAEGLESVDSERRQAAIFRLLRYTLDAKLSGNIGQIVGRGRNSRGVQVIESCANFVNKGRRKRVGIA